MPILAYLLAVAGRKGAIRAFVYIKRWHHPHALHTVLLTLPSTILRCRTVVVPISKMRKLRITAVQGSPNVHGKDTEPALKPKGCHFFIFGQRKFIYLFFIYFIDYLLQLSHFFLPVTPLHPAPPHFSPWVVHISSLASQFPILFLTSPCPFCTYHLCFLFPVPFPQFSPIPSLLITLHVISISVNLFLF